MTDQKKKKKRERHKGWQYIEKDGVKWKGSLGNRDPSHIFGQRERDWRNERRDN